MSKEITTELGIEACAGLFDSHAHYFDRKFNELSGGADALLTDEVFASGVCGIVNVGTNPENSLICIEQARRFEKMYATAGIHPEDAMYMSGDVEALVGKIRDLLDTPEKRRQNKIVAIGEIGLDYHCENCDKERQAEFFEAQLCLAEQTDLPVVIHDRDAHGDCFETVIRHPRVRGVFHSFSGSAEMARELVRRGWYVSFSGVITFKNAKRVREVAESVPLDRVLIETDCPYLTPVPYRSKINHSSLMRYTARELAEVRGLEYSQIVCATAENAAKLFGLTRNL